MIRTVAFALLLAASAAAQETPPAAAPPAATPPVAPAPRPAPLPATVNIAMLTSLGRIVIALEKDRAPVTSAYFLKYVDQKRLDGTTFYRAMKLTPDGSFGLVQGGVLNDPKRVLPPVAHEPTTKTGLTHSEGAISLARLAPGSATANFFIIVGNLPSLDADPKQSGDNAGYAVFGRVIEGMDVVKKIQNAPVSATRGEGSMKGQMIEAPVRIISVARLPRPAVPATPPPAGQ